MPLDQSAERCRIESCAGQRAYAPNVQRALTRLGYVVVEVDTHRDGPAPDLRIADDRNPDSLPTTAQDPRTPIVLLTGSAGWVQDPRVVGRVRRPAGLGDLYRVVQQALETHPRLAPRVATELQARIVRRDQGWPSAIMTLSERGCMAYTTDVLMQGDRVHLHFTLPGFGLIDICARVVWSRDQGAGLVFTDATHTFCAAIDEYVGSRLSSSL